MSTISACDLFRRCVHRRAGGDWQEFLRRYGPRIRGAVRHAFDCRGRCLSALDLEELVQELFCRLLGGTGNYRFRGRTDSQLWAYLARVAHSLAISRRRAAMACKRKACVIPIYDLCEEVAEKLVSAEPTPEASILEEECWRIFLARCHRRLNGDRALKMRALRLALREGWTSREVAHRLGHAIRPEQVDNLIYSVRRRLAEEGLRVPCRRGGWEPRRRAAVCEPPC